MKLLPRTFFGASAVFLGVSSAIGACVSDESGVIAVSTDGGSNPNSNADGSVQKGSDAGTKTPSDAGAPVVDSGPKHYCQTQSAPDGAADFFCADFDESPLSNGFNDASIDEAGSFAATATAASPPNGLLAQVAASDDNDDGAQFIWSQAGANTLSSVNITFDANPILINTTGSKQAFPGFIVLASIATHDTEVDFDFTAGHQFGTQPAYTGYFVYVRHQGQVPSAEAYFADTLLTDQWTEVSLTYDLVNATIALTYNAKGNSAEYDGGLEIASTAKASTETLAFVAVGVASEIDTTQAYGIRFDNVRAFTTRAP